MKKRLTQITLALAAVAVLSACVVITSTSEPAALAPNGAPADGG
ncbi:MAG: hypothetical protein ACLFQ5_07595 [Oceanicaulis sp.]